MLVSVELTPAGFGLSGSGTIKSGREPVICLLGAERSGATLVCAVASFHAGLEPGVYTLSDGSSVRVPADLVSSKHTHHPLVTLEVIS